MSKPWKPGKTTVELPSEPRPSRIRRDPRLVEKTIEIKPRSREQEIWAAAAGVMLIAAGCTALILGFSDVTSFQGFAPAKAPPAPEQFPYCNRGGGPNCVFDGETLYVSGERIGIAGIDAPAVRGACTEESRRGIAAAVRLHDLVNRGPVTLERAKPERGAAGRLMRKVNVTGIDIAAAMIGGGFARESSSEPKPWC